MKGFPPCLRAPRGQEKQLLIYRPTVGFLLTQGAGALYVSYTFLNPCSMARGLKPHWSYSLPGIHKPGYIADIYWTLSICP